MNSRETKLTSVSVVALLASLSLFPLQPSAKINKKDMELIATRIATLAARYDLAMGDIDLVSMPDYVGRGDSARFSDEFEFLTDPRFIKDTNVASRYHTARYGFEEFSVSVYPRGRIGYHLTYNIAIGYDGSVFRLYGFPKSDFQNLIKHYFKRVDSAGTARLMAKWYFGFQGISLAFHDKRLPTKLNKEISGYLRPVRVTEKPDRFILTDYSISFHSEPTSIEQLKVEDSGKRRFNADVFIHRAKIEINKETRAVTTSWKVVKTIHLRNVTKQEYEISHSY